jgi:hypothetical protein
MVFGQASALLLSFRVCFLVIIKTAAKRKKKKELTK